MKEKKYTLKYKVIEDGKIKTVSKTFANLGEARKDGLENISTFVSLKNSKGISLPL